MQLEQRRDPAKHLERRIRKERRRASDYLDRVDLRPAGFVPADINRHTGEPHKHTRAKNRGKQQWINADFKKFVAAGNDPDRY